MTTVAPPGKGQRTRASFTEGVGELRALRPACSSWSPKYTRIGVGFNHKNGGIGVMYDAIPLSGQIVLMPPDAEKPATISYGSPTRKPDFEASMVRESGSNSFWTEIGAAYRQDGYISIQLDVVPASKLVLSPPRDNA
jgi:hypothetical protein